MATATTNYSHPSFSVADDRALSLREEGSRIVTDTIENALRLGGIGLFDERFQFDSSVNWVFGESIEGELDALIPAWDGNGHVIFVQPGIVFWSGIEEEKRIDANLGAVYRTEVFDGIIGGVNLFYDNDFKIGHSRISIGVDAQKDNFYGAFNYYVPLTDTQDGREGYVEDALEGMDAILGIESEAVRFSGNVGYWTYQGDEDTEDEMEFSYGIDGGIRIFPGFFLEGSLQQHDDASIGRRASVGVAVRFSLPDLTGKSYGDNGGVSNLYKFVERERRILYEERVTGPRVSIVRTGNETIAADTEVTVAVDVQLSEALAENVTINLVGSGTATYGDDYMVSVGGTNCPMVTEANCQVMITAGQLTPSGDVTITIINDGRTNEEDESIVLSMVVASPENTDLLPRGSLSLTIPADLPVPSVSLSATSTSITEGGNATLTATLSETVTEDVVINLLEGGAADYGTGMDWHLNNGSDCDTATGTSCQITISANQRSATATVNVNTDSNIESPNETFMVSIGIASPDSTVVIEGSPSMLNFTINDDPPPYVSLNYSGAATVQHSSNVRMRVDLSEALNEAVTINFLDGGGTASYGQRILSGDDWVLQHRNVPAGGDVSSSPFSIPSCPGVTGVMCQATIPADVTIVEVSIDVHPNSSDGTQSETIILDIEIASAGSTGLILGNRRQEITIAPSR